MIIKCQFNSLNCLIQLGRVCVTNRPNKKGRTWRPFLYIAIRSQFLQLQVKLLDVLLMLSVSDHRVY